jgi:hypothetical protein
MVEVDDDSGDGRKRVTTMPVCAQSVQTQMQSDAAAAVPGMA